MSNIIHHPKQLLSPVILLHLKSQFVDSTYMGVKTKILEEMIVQDDQDCAVGFT